MVGPLTWVASLAPTLLVFVTGLRAMWEMDGAAKELFLKRSMPPIDIKELVTHRSQVFDGSAGMPDAASTTARSVTAPAG